MHHHEILFDQKPVNGSGSSRRLDVAFVDNKIDRMATCADQNALDKEFKIKFSEWGFKIDRLFEVAYRFYKRNENKAFHLGFDERNRMVALTMQAKFGNFDGSKVPDVGVLDLVGRRRQHEWSLLNGMTKTEAMTKFICELDVICPIFKAHAEAVKISSGIESRSPMNDELLVGEDKIINYDGDPDGSKLSVQMPGMYAALCKQTHNQFKAYALKQHPDEPDKQKHLIASLQEQYYQQYISQSRPKQIEQNGNSNVQSNSYLAASKRTESNNDIGRSPNVKPEKSNNDCCVNDAVDHIDNFDELATEARDAAQNPITRYRNSESSEAPPNKISDINCEDNNVQADISNEELNSELDFNLADHPRGDCSPMVAHQQPIEGNLDSMSPSLKAESNEPSVLEVVKLCQNPNTYPIAMFESFPEPKLVSVSRGNSAPLDTMDPNLPAKTIRSNNCSDGTGIEQESGTTTTAESKHVDNLVPEKNTSGQNQHNSQDEANLDLTRNEAVDTAACNSLNGYNNLLTTSDVTNENFDLESQIQCEQETLANKPPYQPELWGPISPGRDQESTEQTSSIDYGQFEPASIRTKRAVAEFKDSLSGDKQGGVYEVREGSIIVIQVPTYPDGRYIYWEFATDNYDIGFGLDFVYAEKLIEPLALEIYEDNDENDDSESPIEAYEVDEVNHDRSEIAQERNQSVTETRRRLTDRLTILPTYRRDSHEEVHVGRHKYPGRGYYLLRFDNTYSVLRSKTLYFRICYFM